MANRPNDFDPDELERQLRQLGRVGCEIGRQVGTELGKGLKKGFAQMEQTMTRRTETRPAPRAASRPVQPFRQTQRPARDPRAYGRMRLRTGRVFRKLGGWLATAAACPLAFQTAVMLDEGSIVTAAICAVFAAAFLAGAAWFFAGARMRRRAVAYLDTIGQRSSCSVAELAAAAGCSQRRVWSDLRALASMPGMGQMFLSEDSSQVFFSQEAYKQYQQQTCLQPNSAPCAGPDAASLEILHSAAAQTAQMEQLLPLLDDESVRRQAARLHELSEKIVQQVRQHPEKQADIRKFCRYYLPTTIKLLRTYAQLDDDPVEGIHTNTIRSDIPGILHTLDKAFSSLLDSLYADVAMDVSSDIRVLRSMLEQEGLADSQNKL